MRALVLLAIFLGLFLTGSAQSKGNSILIGIPESSLRVDLNDANPEEINKGLVELSKRMPKKHQKIWLSSNEDSYLLQQLSKSISSERSNGEENFKNIAEVTHFITAYSDQNHIPRAAVMSLLQVMMESHVIIIKDLEKE